MAFYELRQYSILPGKMDDWVEFMETTIIPFQVSQGMVITASFRAEEDESVYIWMRRFEYGPVEWLWRSATYRRIQPFKSVG